MKKNIGYALLIIGIICFCVGLWFLAIPNIIGAIILFSASKKEEEKEKTKE